MLIPPPIPAYHGHGRWSERTAQWNERRNTQRHTCSFSEAHLHPALCWCNKNMVNANWFHVNYMRNNWTPNNRKMCISEYKPASDTKNHSQGKGVWFFFFFLQHLISMETAAGITDRPLLNFDCQKNISRCWLMLSWSVHAGSNSHCSAVPSVPLCR